MAAAAGRVEMVDHLSPSFPASPGRDSASGERRGSSPLPPPRGAPPSLHPSAPAVGRGPARRGRRVGRRAPVPVSREAASGSARAPSPLPAGASWAPGWDGGRGGAVARPGRGSPDRPRGPAALRPREGWARFAGEDAPSRFFFSLKKKTLS
jgi:hypothetical protein